MRELDIRRELKKDQLWRLSREAPPQEGCCGVVVQGGVEDGEG